MLTISILFNIAPRVGSFKKGIMLKHIVTFDNNPTLHIITTKEEVLSSASPSYLRLSFPLLIFPLYFTKLGVRKHNLRLCRIIYCSCFMFKVQETDEFFFLVVRGLRVFSQNPQKKIRQLLFISVG